MPAKKKSIEQISGSLREQQRLCEKIRKLQKKLEALKAEIDNNIMCLEYQALNSVSMCAASLGIKLSDVEVVISLSGGSHTTEWEPEAWVMSAKCSPELVKKLIATHNRVAAVKLTVPRGACSVLRAEMAETEES